MTAIDGAIPPIAKALEKRGYTTLTPVQLAMLDPAAAKELLERVVAHTGGPLLVVAGPGTGKTRALTERYAWLVEEGTPAECVLALTFSEPAAAAMRARLEAALDRPYEELNVLTFHAFCVKLLQDEALEAGVDPFFSPVTPADRLALLLDRIDDNFVCATLRYGYMDTVNVPTDLARSPGLLAGPGGTSFFVGRSAIRFSAKPFLPRWMTIIYMFLHRNASDPTAYFAIPPNRVVELGSQVEI